jgi:hypothetical protein
VFVYGLPYRPLRRAPSGALSVCLDGGFRGSFLSVNRARVPLAPLADKLFVSAGSKQESALRRAVINVFALYIGNNAPALKGGDEFYRNKKVVT